MRSDLVTQQISCGSCASSQDAPLARPARDGHWRSLGSSLCPWAKLAIVADCGACWPCDSPVVNNTAGGNRSADPVRITDRNNGTYVVGIGSSDAPETEHQSCAGKSAPAEENPAGRRLIRREEDDLAEAWKKTQPKNTYTFRSADSLHFQPGVGRRNMCQPPSTFQLLFSSVRVN